MTIKYKFVTGEEVYIEVYGRLEKIVTKLDRNLYSNNQTETKRHISLNLFDGDDKAFIDTAPGFEERILSQVDRETLYKAISNLKLDEQELIHNLYLNDKPVTQKQYAKMLNITEKSVQEKFRHICKKLKKFIYEKIKCF